MMMTMELSPFQLYMKNLVSAVSASVEETVADMSPAAAPTTEAAEAPKLIVIVQPDNAVAPTRSLRKRLRRPRTLNRLSRRAASAGACLQRSSCSYDASFSTSSDKSSPAVTFLNDDSISSTSVPALRRAATNESLLQQNHLQSWEGERTSISISANGSIGSSSSASTSNYMDLSNSSTSSNSLCSSWMSGGTAVDEYGSNPSTPISQHQTLSMDKLIELTSSSGGPSPCSVVLPLSPKSARWSARTRPRFLKQESDSALVYPKRASDTPLRDDAEKQLLIDPATSPVDLVIESL